MARRGTWFSRDELRLIGQKDNLPELPIDGSPLELTVVAGTGTGDEHATRFASIFKDQFDVALYGGTFNLRARTQIHWPSPRIFPGTDAVGFDFCPVIIQRNAGEYRNRAVGVAMRRGHAEPTLLEVLSPRRLRDALHADDGDVVEVWMLDGKWLKPPVE